MDCTYRDPLNFWQVAARRHSRRRPQRGLARLTDRAPNQLLASQVGYALLRRYGAERCLR